MAKPVDTGPRDLSGNVGGLRGPNGNEDGLRDLSAKEGRSRDGTGRPVRFENRRKPRGPRRACAVCARDIEHGYNYRSALFRLGRRAEGMNLGLYCSEDCAVRSGGKERSPRPERER